MRRPDGERTAGCEEVAPLMRIGIDVGGTNTDVVLVDGQRVVDSLKVPTQPDVTTGIVSVLKQLHERNGYRTDAVDAIMIGTTHFINALIERRRLAPSAAIRLGLPATAALPPMVEWPESLVEAICGTPYLCHGGNEYDGRVITRVDRDELRRVVDDIVAKELRCVAVTSVFSPVTAEAEAEAAAIIAEHAPHLLISQSHEIGRIGLLERENATIINAALSELAIDIVRGLRTAISGLGYSAALYLSQNDGTLMDIEYARRFPVSTFASGPTNSMRGAALLSGLSDCAVVDVGGTTSDIGILQGGFPRESNVDVTVAGVRTNFRMPDVLSVGIGGGSIVGTDPSGGPDVGPQSVGHEITERALVFGGEVLTATDVAVAKGWSDLGDPERVSHLSQEYVDQILDRIVERIAEGVDRMRVSARALPLVAVGGGSILLPAELPGLGEVVHLEHHAVANAVGAALGMISGEVDRVFSVPAGQRESLLDEAKQEAVDRAVRAGAVPATVEVVDVDEVPLAYLPGNATRIRVRAVGELNLKHAAPVAEEGVRA